MWLLYLGVTIVVNTYSLKRDLDNIKLWALSQDQLNHSMTQPYHNISKTQHG